ncbi:hypothetical protein E2562_005543, partial [Oryza meyeriana var. granulata]
PCRLCSCCVQLRSPPAAPLPPLHAQGILYTFSFGHIVRFLSVRHRQDQTRSSQRTNSKSVKEWNSWCPWYSRL